MTTRVAIAIALLVVASATAWWVERRRRTEAPTRDRHPVPRQVDRADFPRRDAPWLVVVFSSATCASCASIVDKVAVLESSEVAVVDVEYGARPDLHRRYGIDAVPMVVVADAEGVARAAFVGPATATDLWAAVAELRRPGSTPEPGIGRLDLPGDGGSVGAQ